MAACTKVAHGDSTWSYDTFDEFLADFRKYSSFATCDVYGQGFELDVVFEPRSVNVLVAAPYRPTIEAVFDVFEKSVSDSHLQPIPKPKDYPLRPVIFIGQGRSPAWRDLKDHLKDKHGMKIEAYESGARAGHTIRDILEEMVTKSSFALLVLTGEDEQADGTHRARQNVIHEAGLFQGRLGFPRAIILLE